MEIKPEDYLNLDSLDMYGPASIRFKGEEAPAPSPTPTTVDGVAAALREAQLRGDHGAIGLLSIQLDDLVNNTPATHAQSRVSDAQVVSSDTQEAPQQPELKEDTDSSCDTDEPAEDAPELLESDFNRSLVAELGSDKVDAIYTTINNCGDDEVIASFMDSVDGDGVYANDVIEWAKQAADAGATPTGEASFSAFDDAAIANIQNNSAYAEDIINLNKLVSSGQMTQAQLYQQVMQDPGLMAEAVKLRNANIISF